MPRPDQANGDSGSDQRLSASVNRTEEQTQCVCHKRSSIVIGGGAQSSAPRDDGPRLRDLLERRGVNGMYGKAGGADRDAERRRKLEVLDSRDDPVDDAERVFEVGVQQ